MWKQLVFRRKHPTLVPADTETRRLGLTASLPEWSYEKYVLRFAAVVIENHGYNTLFLSHKGDALAGTTASKTKGKMCLMQCESDGEDATFVD